MNYEKQYVKSMMGLMLSVSLIAGGTISVYVSDTTETAIESTTEAGSEADGEAPQGDKPDEAVEKAAGQEEGAKKRPQRFRQKLSQ